MRFLIGGVASIAGIAIILSNSVFHKHIKRFKDQLGKALMPNIWTGTYSRGGELFERAAGLVCGGLALIWGMLILLNIIQ